MKSRANSADVKSHIGEVEGQLGDVKGQLSENTQFIKALLHRTEELDAKFDGLLHNTVNKDMLAHPRNKRRHRRLRFQI